MILRSGGTDTGVACTIDTANQTQASPIENRSAPRDLHGVVVRRKHRHLGTTSG